MADAFEMHSIVEQERQKLWPLIEQTPWLNWLLLTKRPHTSFKWSPGQGSFPTMCGLERVWKNQQRAEERIPLLLQVPASVRFLSCEPLLEAVDLSPWLPELQWVIVGGESGSDARTMEPSWPRCLREQCVMAGTPYFFKHGEDIRQRQVGVCLMEEPGTRCLQSFRTEEKIVVIDPAHPPCYRAIDGAFGESNAALVR